MKKMFTATLATLLTLCLAALPALAQEKTIQGRCIDFDPAKRLATFIKDAKNDMQTPDYQLPPVSFELPKDTPDPKAGKRMKLDTKKNQIVIFDPVAKAFKVIDYKLVSQKENVGPDDALVAGKKFPAVDKARKVVTVYSKRQKVLTEFTPPDDLLTGPDNTWDNGDEIKVTYATEGKALTFENLSRK